MLSVDIPQSLEKRLDHWIKNNNLSLGSCVKEALERYLEDEEDLADAEAAYEEHIRSGEKTYTLEEIKKLHGLD